MDAIERWLRTGEAMPAGSHVLRGSPLSAEKIADHAARTARAYSYQGQPCYGVSVELAPTVAGQIELLRGRRLSTRRLVGRIAVDEAIDAGFVLLPTFTYPHYTLLIGRAPSATIEALVALATADVLENPYYQARKEV
jgi:hypothetical protein